LKYRKAWSAGLILLVLLAVGVRLRLLSIPLERDEGEYAYSGQLMLQGIPPYQLAFNIKMPGTYAAYALLMALFGESPSGIHLGFLFINLGTLALLFYLARRLFDEAGVLVCCAAYVLLSLSSSVLGLQAHATHLVVIHALGGLCLLLRARENGKRSTLFLSGLLFGLSFLCKQPGLFFGLFALALLARDAWVAGVAQWRLCARNLFLFSAGLITPLAVTCLLLWRAGTFRRFWFWTVTYAQVHTGLLPAGFVRHRLAQMSSHGFERWLFLMGVAGLLWLLCQKGQAERKFFFSGFLICSVAACLIGRYLAQHYFVVLLPAISLLAGLAVPAFAGLLARTRFPPLRFLPAGLFIGVCAGLVHQNGAVWFELPPAVASAAIYFNCPFVECLEIGRFIREHSAPRDRLAVVGSEPEIYFYAQRRSVSGYIYMYDLVEPQPYARAMQQEFIHDVETAKPEFLVVVNTGTSWMTWADADPALFNWIRRYPGSGYDLVGVAEIYPSHTEYRWGREAAAEERKTDNAIFTFKRK
jgi:4-amino-4-deoxy-L-arabinose transferase-like glycosyltransferase